MTVVSAQISAPNLVFVAVLPVLHELGPRVALQFDELSITISTFGLLDELLPVKMSMSSAFARLAHESAHAAALAPTVARPKAAWERSTSFIERSCWVLMCSC